MKIRGVYARRSDMPEYVRRMQMECFKEPSKARNRDGINAMYPELVGIYRKYVENLGNANLEDLIVRRVLGTLRHSKRSLEASAVKEYEKIGIKVLPKCCQELLWSSWWLIAKERS